MMSSEDKDLEYKLQMMRFLWRLGYYVKSNVKLIRETPEGKGDITDIDVLGLKIDNNLETKYVICDCRNRAKQSNSERLLWISGLMSYFNAQTAYYYREGIASTEYIEMMEKLNIKCITSTHMKLLENIYNIDKEVYFGPFTKNQKGIEDYFKKIRDIDSKQVDYLLINYWSNLPQQQILQIISYCRSTVESEKINKELKKFLILYSLSLLSVSLLNFSNIILMLPDGQNETVTKEILMSGKYPFKERKKIVESFYDFMVTEIKVRYKETFPIPKDTFIKNIVPKYEPFLTDFILRLIGNPESALIIPRFLDLLLYEKIVNNNDFDYQLILQGLPTSNLSLKILKDFRVFCERSNIINEDINAIIKENIINFESIITPKK